MSLNNLLIAPEGIEIRMTAHTVQCSELLIAPEGIEMTYIRNVSE